MSPDNPPSGPTRTDDHDTTGRRFATLVLGYLSATVLSAIGGIVIGGWLAFETDHWKDFKAIMEGLGDDAVLLAVGLLLVAVVVSTGAAAYARPS